MHSKRQGGVSPGLTLHALAESLESTLRSRGSFLTSVCIEITHMLRRHLLVRLFSPLHSIQSQEDDPRPLHLGRYLMYFCSRFMNAGSVPSKNRTTYSFAEGFSSAPDS